MICDRPRSSGAPAALVRGAAVLLTLTGLSGCRLDPLGKPCVADDQCGPGYDCFRNVCFQVCTNDGECRSGEECHRYHCFAPGEETRRARPHSGRSAASPGAVPPIPDATVAELRAMRHELEVLRRDVAKLLAAQGLESSGGSPAPGEARRDMSDERSDRSPAPQPTKSVITLPLAAPTLP